VTRRAARLSPAACAALACIAGTGCRSLERFDTSGEEHYCGAVVSSSFVLEGFVPAGAPPDLRLRMTLDTTAIASVPARLWTDDSNDGPCSAPAGGAQPQPLFEGAELRAIERLESDPMSGLEFGEERELNFVGWVDSSCEGTVLAVVSLMKSDDVEVRLLKPAAGGESAWFALFPLSKQTGTCGF
jgi:hypothetical protein